MQFQLLGKLALDSHVSDLQFTFLGDHKRIPSWPQFDFPSSLASFLHPDIKDHITVLVLFDDISSFTCFEQILSTGVQFPSLFIQIRKQRLQYEKIVSIRANQLKIQTWKVCGL